MDKIKLFDQEFDVDEIDYIGIRKVSLFKPEYSIVVGYNSNEINMEKTKTADELMVLSLLQITKERLNKYNNFISIDKYSPLINIYRAKDVELKKCEYVNKNYLKITLRNGHVCLTKQEPFSDRGLNKWQYYYNVYWSRRNDHACAK